MDNEQFLEKPLPSSPESERVILGAILLDNALVAEAVESLEEQDFYSPLHRRVFRAMTSLFERGEKIDPILIGEEIKKEGSLEAIGGVATITNLAYGLPHFSNLETYIKTVRDKKTVRDLVRTCNEISSVALGEEESVEDLANFAEQKIFDVCNQPTTSHPEPISTLAFHSVQNTIDFMKSGVKSAGLTTGFTDIDTMTGGWKKTDFIIVAARPSMGKSSFVCDCASNAAKDEKSVVAFFSLEMSKEQLAARLLCSEARVDVARYINKFLTREEVGRITDALGRLKNRKILIDDTPGISPVEMQAKARRILADQKRLDLIVVDYLQLMTGSGKRSENRQQEVSQISRELKLIAKLLKVPVIALSQLSRAPEARNPPRPMMSDLRESGSLEQDSDLVAFIFREEYYKPSDENAGVAEIIISKNRNGPTGTVKLSFLREFTRFENYYDDYRTVDTYTPPRERSYYEPAEVLEEDPLFKI